MKPETRKPKRAAGQPANRLGRRLVATAAHEFDPSMAILGAPASPLLAGDGPPDTATLFAAPVLAQGSTTCATPQPIVGLGAFDVSDTTFSLQSPTAVGPPGVAGITRPVLLQNHPNPVRARSTLFSFYLPEPAEASLKIYDLSGRLVRTLVEGARDSGPHSVVWNGTNDGGQGVPAGTYVVNFDAWLVTSFIEGEPLGVSAVELETMLDEAVAHLDVDGHPVRPDVLAGVGHRLAGCSNEGKAALVQRHVADDHHVVSVLLHGSPCRSSGG